MLYRTLVKPSCRRKRSSVSRRKGALRQVKQLVLLLLNAEIKAGVASWLCNQMVHVSDSGTSLLWGKRKRFYAENGGREAAGQSPFPAVLSSALRAPSPLLWGSDLRPQHCSALGCEHRLRLGQGPGRPPGATGARFAPGRSGRRAGAAPARGQPSNSGVGLSTAQRSGSLHHGRQESVHRGLGQLVSTRCSATPCPLPERGTVPTLPGTSGPPCECCGVPRAPPGAGSLGAYGSILPVQGLGHRQDRGQQRGAAEHLREPGEHVGAGGGGGRPAAHRNHQHGARERQVPAGTQAAPQRGECG